MVGKLAPEGNGDPLRIAIPSEALHRMVLGAAEGCPPIR